MSQVEGPLFSQGYLLDQQDFQQWSDLLAEAMQGKLDYQRIMGIPAFAPVKNDCMFLRCGCSISVTRFGAAADHAGEGGIGKAAPHR